MNRWRDVALVALTIMQVTTLALVANARYANHRDASVTPASPPVVAAAMMKRDDDPTVYVDEARKIAVRNITTACFGQEFNASVKAKESEAVEKGFKFYDGCPPSNSALLAVAPAQPAEPAKRFEIVDVAYRPGESNESWTRYSWKLTLRNVTDTPLLLDATIEFRDADHFSLDHDNEYKLPLGPGETKEFTGEKLIDATLVNRIAGVNAKVGVRR